MQGRIESRGGPWAVFNNEALEAHPTLEYQKKIKGDKTYVDAFGQLPSLPIPKFIMTMMITITQYLFIYLL